MHIDAKCHPGTGKLVRPPDPAEIAEKIDRAANAARKPKRPRPERKEPIDETPKTKPKPPKSLDLPDNFLGDNQREPQAMGRPGWRPPVLG
ncbi:MAG: hypothetical protein FJZ01_04115 [Candidatus Sericytochromatia bacterium]|nr:hypothetical protein [Candidatus Tanganyikabacteria bacterium]